MNAGEDGSIVVGKILDNDSYAYGFDAQTGEFGNLLTKGVIDPTKVVRTALQGAASIAGLLITTEAMVAEEPRENMHPEGIPTRRMEATSTSEPTPSAIGMLPRAAYGRLRSMLVSH